MFKFKKEKKVTLQHPEEVTEELSKLKEENKKIKEEVRKLKEEKKLFLQNIGVVRFNPFSDEGGNQSFSLALLSGEGNGVAITSLYTKEGNRIYGKPVKNGKSEYSLSKEEEKAIQAALGKNN